MKKFIVSLMVVFATTLFVPTAKAQVNFGVVGGLNLSSMSLDKMPSFDSDNRCGWYIGPKVVVTLPVVGLGIDGSVQYSQRRLNLNTSIAGTEASASTNYKSVEVPINLRYGIGLSSLASVLVYTGPQFGFNIGEKNWKQNLELKKSVVTWNIGAALRVLKKVEVGAGYNFALGKIGEVAGLNDASFKANTWQVQLTYYLK